MLQLESSNYPHTLMQWLYTLLALFLGSGWGVAAWQRRKHGPVEVRKMAAEARSIEIRDEIAIGDSVLKLVKEVAVATIEVERLRDERDHWERKAEGLQEQLDMLTIEVNSADHQMRKQMSFIKAIGREKEYLALDQPKD